MTAVDQLLTLLVEDSRKVSKRMAALGYTEDQIREAWREARRLGHIESTEFGPDRLTDAGRTAAEGRDVSYADEPPVCRSLSQGRNASFR